MNYKDISNKYLLLDSNVLINYFYNQTEYQSFFDKLRENKVSLLIDEVVTFEILRISENKGNRDAICDFFSELGIDIAENLLSKPDKVSDIALDIANIYQAKYNASSKVSYADFFLSASMAYYNREKTQMYFATENHRDFPVSICFERLGVEIIDTQGDDSSDIHNIGIYRFNTKEFLKYKKELGFD